MLGSEYSEQLYTADLPSEQLSQTDTQMAAAHSPINGTPPSLAEVRQDVK